MPFPLILAAVAGTQLLAGGQQAETIMNNAKIQKAVNDRNAEFAEADAWEAEKFGFTEASRYQEVIDSTKSDQRTAYASKGVDVNYGTAADAQEETSLTGYLNIIDIKRQARNKAMGLRREASNYRLGAGSAESQATMNAGAAQTSAIFNAGATALSGYSRK